MGHVEEKSVISAFIPQLCWSPCARFPVVHRVELGGYIFVCMQYKVGCSSVCITCVFVLLTDGSAGASNPITSHKTAKTFASILELGPSTRCQTPADLAREWWWDIDLVRMTTYQPYAIWFHNLLNSCASPSVLHRRPCLCALEWDDGAYCTLCCAGMPLRPATPIDSGLFCLMWANET